MTRLARRALALSLALSPALAIPARAEPPPAKGFLPIAPKFPRNPPPVRPVPDPIPLTEPPSWFAKVGYPKAARNGEGGMVRYRATVDAAGRVTACAILASSRHWVLDEATCQAVSRNARFAPLSGPPPPRYYNGSIRWIAPGE